MVSLTSAKLSGLRVSLPLKMTLAISSPRSCFALRSPSTHLMASATLLLPEPLGPTSAERLSSNSKTVRSAKDLNP